MQTISEKKGGLGIKINKKDEEAWGEIPPINNFVQV